MEVSLHNIIMKKLLVILLSVLMIVGIIPVSAESNDNITDEEEFLLQYISEKVPEFSMDDGEIVSVVQFTGCLSSESNGPQLNPISPLGAIGDNYMTITVAVQRINLDQPSYDSFKFTAVADWLSAPLFRGEDAFAIAWSDDFTRINSICKAYYNSMGYISGKTSMIDATPEAGVCYAVDCSYYYGNALDYVTLVANVRKPDSSDSAEVVTKYAHSTINIFSGLGVSIGKEPSISFSPSGNVDTKAAGASFTY